MFACTTCTQQFTNVKKLKMCHFCRMGNCPTCLYKSKPYAIDMTAEKPAAQSKRGMVCKHCFKKFLFRDAIHEETKRLLEKSLKEPSSSSDQMMPQLEKDFRRVIGSLMKASMIKANLSDSFYKELQALNKQVTNLQEELAKERAHSQMAMEQNDSEKGKIEELLHKKEEAQAEVDRLNEQINKFYAEFEGT